MKTPNTKSIKRRLKKTLSISLMSGALFVAYSIAGGVILQKLEVPIPPFVESLVMLVM
jgi:hypothetical protein